MRIRHAKSFLLIITAMLCIAFISTSAAAEETRETYLFSSEETAFHETDELYASYVPNEAWEAEAARQFAASSVRCGVLIVMKDGEPLIVSTYGNIDSKKTPVTVHTRFKIASVTKMVTAIGLMHLYDQGLMDLDAPLSTYLPMKVANPSFPDEEVTMRQVLSHTSSLKSGNRYLPDWENLAKDNNFFQKNLHPGTKYIYANLNGGLCGATVEALSGMSVNTYMKYTIFHPLGIDAAYNPGLLSDQEDISPLMSTAGAITASVSKLLATLETYDDICDPGKHTDRTAGGLFISADGLTRLMMMMANGGVFQDERYLEESTVRLMETDQQTVPGSSVHASSDYGLFLTKIDEFGSPWYGHQGRLNGLTSNAFYQPDTGMTFVMIVNGYGGKSQNGLSNLSRRMLNFVSHLLDE